MKTLSLLLLSTVFVFAQGAVSAEEIERPVAEWIDVIEAEAKTWYQAELPNFAAIRLAAAWTMPNLSNKAYQTKQVSKQWPLFTRWMEESGYPLLTRILRDEQLAASDEPYRCILLGLYLRAGIDQQQPDKSSGRYWRLDITKVAGGRDACLTFREKINEQGRAALRKGYLTGKLTLKEVEAIRLYRIAQGQRGVGESFLPHHLGLHPRSDSSHETHRQEHAVVAANHGHTFYDFQLATLERVLQSSQYSERHDRNYHLTYSLRPEGVLDFLRVLDGYERDPDIKDREAVRLKPEKLERPASERASDWVRLSDRVGRKPIALLINDPIDGPMTEMFPAFQSLYEIYRNQVEFYFVANDIHDWYYSGMDDVMTGPQPTRISSIHSWNQEERARKAKNRYLESPHASFPCLISDDWQSIKSRYGAGGGATYFVVIDIDGNIAGCARVQTGNLNYYELLLRKVLDNGGRIVQDTPALMSIDRSEYESRTMYHPANKRVRLHDAVVESVSAERNELVVARDGFGPDGQVTIHLKPFARVTRDEVPISLSDVAKGNRVAVDFFLNDYLSPAPARDEETSPGGGKPVRVVSLGGQQLQMTLLGHYGSESRRWYVDRATRADPIPARGVRILSAHQIQNPRSEPPVIWLSGKVLRIDPATHQVTLHPVPFDAIAAKGLRFRREADAKGQELYLSTVAQARHDEVERWTERPQATIEVLADEAVDYTLNGVFTGGFSDIETGDWLGLRYYPGKQPDGLLVPHTIRISKPVDVPTKSGGTRYNHIPSQS